MAMEESIEEKIKDIVLTATCKPDVNFTVDTTFQDLEADSMDVVQILIALEDAFDIEIASDKEIRKCRNMGDLISYVAKKIEAKKSP